MAAAALTDYVVTNSHRDDVAKLEAAVIAQTQGEVQSFINEDILTQTSVEIPNGGNIFATSSIPAQEYVLGQTLGALPFLQSEEYINLAGMETAAADRNDLLGVPSSSLQNLSTSPAFQTAKAGNYYLSPVTFADGMPDITFASPVKDSNGEIIGVISGVASLGDLQTIVASATIGNTGYLYLVDQNGATHRRRREVWQVISGAQPLRKYRWCKKWSAGRARSRRMGSCAMRTRPGRKWWRQGSHYWKLGKTGDWLLNGPRARRMPLSARCFCATRSCCSSCSGLSSCSRSCSRSSSCDRSTHWKKRRRAWSRESSMKGVSITTGDELEELGDSFNDMVMGLKQLEQLKDEFVFIAAHELRTPVAAMKGYLQLILDGTTGEIPDATRSFIEKVIASNQRLIQLVNDLLEVARSQAGRLTIKVAPVDITPTITSTIDELKSLADEKGVTITYAPACRPCRSCSPTRTA